jgi:hypothetical protein
MFRKKLTGPSHIALHFWGFLLSRFVLLNAVGKIVVLGFFFVLELISPADTFQNAVIF